MVVNKLKPNPTETVFIIVLLKHHFRKHGKQIKVGEAVIQPRSIVRNLGFYIDRYNSCEAHANSLYKKIYFHINCIGRAKRFLPRVTLRSVVTALVLSHLDYCNAMLSGATAFQLGRLQRLQNRAAQLITGFCIRDHITPFLKELYWLLVELRIHFKVLIYIFKALLGQAPQYL